MTYTPSAPSNASASASRLVRSATAASHPFFTSGSRRPAVLLTPRTFFPAAIKRSATTLPVFPVIPVTTNMRLPPFGILRLDARLIDSDILLMIRQHRNLKAGTTKPHIRTWGSSAFPLLASNHPVIGVETSED